jgi:hypothetical protein
MKVFKYILTFVVGLLLCAYVVRGQSIDLQLNYNKVCNNQIAVDLWLSASSFSTDTFTVGNSSFFLNYDGTKIGFSQYIPDAFDPSESQQAADANWVPQQYDYNDDFGLFHIVLQKNAGGTDHYEFYSGAAPIRIGTIVFNFLEAGSTHDIAVSFSLTNINEGTTNDGSQQINLANIPSITILNDASLWSEDFSTLVDGTTRDNGISAWEVDPAGSNSSAVNYYLATFSGRFRFRSLEAEAVWRSQWINLCGNGASISIDLRESGSQEDDDYIRAYYQVDDGPEVLIGEIVDDAINNNTYYSFSTNGIVSGNQVRIIVRAKNGINGDFEVHEFDNIQFTTNECFKPVTPDVASITDTSALLSWSPDFDAESYTVQYRVMGETTWDAGTSNDVFELSTTSTSQTIFNLLPDTEYEYQIQSVCAVNVAPFSSTDQFKTNICADIANVLIGQPCNDDNPDTNDDIFTSECACVGFLIPLSVDLLYFTAQTKEKVVDLEWETASETNNDYFRVERSANGIDWEGIIQIPGAGTTNEPLTYRTTDAQPLAGYSFYRLAQVDYDGTLTYSKVVTAFLDQKDGLDNLVLYPNPARNQIDLSQPVAGFFSITDAFGKMVIQGTLNSQAIDISNLPGGIYILEIETPVKTISRKIIKE